MKNKTSVYIIIAILAAMLLLYWFTGASEPSILGWGMIALCVYLLADTLYTAHKRRPTGFRKKFQFSLSVVGTVALIAALLYFMLIRGLD